MAQKDNFVKQYMVEFEVPQPMTEDMFLLVPEQKQKFDELFTSGKLLSYSLSMDRERLWAIFMASSESELLTYIDMLPMTPYMDFDYDELMFYNTVSMLPSMSLN